MKFLVFTLTFFALSLYVFGDNKELLDVLLKRAEELKNRTKNDLDKYENSSHYHMVLKFLKRDLDGVEDLQEFLKELRKKDNLTKHDLRELHHAESRLLSLENSLEEELYFLEHGHEKKDHHHHHHDNHHDNHHDDNHDDNHDHHPDDNHHHHENITSYSDDQHHHHNDEHEHHHDRTKMESIKQFFKKLIHF